MASEVVVVAGGGGGRCGYCGRRDWCVRCGRFARCGVCGVVVVVVVGVASLVLPAQALFVLPPHARWRLLALLRARKLVILCSVWLSGVVVVGVGRVGVIVGVAACG